MKSFLGTPRDSRENTPLILYFLAFPRNPGMGSAGQERWVIKVIK
jgi:hypothetical protein